MKKAMLLLNVILMFQFYANAQTEAPVIIKLHGLLQSAKNNFVNDLDKKIDEDTATHTVYYEAKLPLPDAECFFVHQPSGQNMMVITYNTKADKATQIMPVVDQYMDELNKMVKTGNYTGEDYKSKTGLDVTDVKDKAGNVILRYTSSRELQRIYLYGLITTK